MELARHYLRTGFYTTADSEDGVVGLRVTFGRLSTGRHQLDEAMPLVVLLVFAPATLGSVLNAPSVIKTCTFFALGTNLGCGENSEVRIAVTAFDRGRD